MSKSITFRSALFVIIGLFLVSPSLTFALEIKSTAAKEAPKQTKQLLTNKYLTAKETYELVKANPNTVLFIDVRTLAEVEFVGWTSLVDAVIPFVANDFTEWDEQKHRYKKIINDDFQIVFEELVGGKNLTKDTLIIFMCRSGSRSAKAASLVSNLGYTQAYTVENGFEGDKLKEGVEKGHRLLSGWKNSGLPWGYNIDPNKMRFNQ